MRSLLRRRIGREQRLRLFRRLRRFTTFEEGVFMAMERVPYLVGGGFEHSAEVMRAMLAAATSGAEGIVNAGDMKVLPLSVPGTGVRIMPGNALIRNSYGGGQAQTYAARAGSQTEVSIDATGSSGGR